MEPATVMMIGVQGDHQPQTGPTLRLAVMDVTGRKASEALLHERDAQLRHLTAQLLLAQETERRRLARDLHDDVTQRLAALAIDREGLRLVPRESEDFRSRLDTLCAMVDRLTTDVQHVAHQLHPSLLDHAGLEAAVREQVEGFEARTGLTTAIEVRDLPKTLPLPQATCLFRVLQESLSNVRKHADASTVLVRLLRTGRGVGVCVHDDGRGFHDTEGGSRRKGRGLTSMEEQIRLLNGTFQLRTKPGDGTEVHAWVPVDDGDSDGRSVSHAMTQNQAAPIERKMARLLSQPLVPSAALLRCNTFLGIPGGFVDRPSEGRRPKLLMISAPPHVAKKQMISHSL